MSRVSIVALDMSRIHSDVGTYGKLSAEKKIAHLAEVIKKTCEELTKNEPNNQWIIAWREYGISEKDSLFVSNETKNAFKKAMQALTEKYPQLTIVSGSVATKKHFEKFTLEDTGEILQEYQSSSLLRIQKQEVAHFEEFKTHTTKADDLKEEFLQTEAHIATIKAIQKNLSSSTHSGIDVVRNSCFIFQGKEMLRHDKIAPDDETKSHAATVFRPGKGITQSPFIKLKNFNIGVEICKEHSFGILQHDVSTRKSTARPLIHFVLSDSIALNTQALCGDYAVHLDSRYKPQLILSKETEKNPEVNLYQVNMLDKEPTLRGPLEPLYPFNYKLRDLLDKTLLEFGNDKNNKKYKLLSAMRDECQKIFEDRGIIANESYFDILNEIVEKYAPSLKEKEKTTSLFSFSFFQKSVPKKEVDLVTMLNELQKMIETEMKKNPTHIDYRQMDDIPLQQKTTTLSKELKHSS